MLFQSRSLATATSLAPKFLLSANMPQYFNLPGVNRTKNNETYRQAIGCDYLKNIEIIYMIPQP
jgi:hypothetical protein